MALKFNPFEQDKPAAIPATRRNFSKLRVFDEPPKAQVAPDAPAALQKVALDATEIPLEHTAEQMESKWRANRELKESNQGENGEQIGSKRGANREQTGVRLAKWGANGEQTESKWEAKQGAEQGANGEQTESKKGASAAVSLLTGLQRLALFHIVEMCKMERSQISPPVTPERLAETLCTSPMTTKDTIKRLVRKGLMATAHSKKGRGGWSQYRVPNDVYQEVLKIGQEGKWGANGEQMGSKWGPKKGAKRGASSCSSSSINTPSTTEEEPSSDKQLAEVFQQALERFEFANTLGSSDILQLWRSGVFESPLELVESVEHIAFYLNSPDSKGIESPRGFAMRQLRNGFYAQPNNFRSWAARQEDAKIAAKRQRAAELLAAKRELFMAEFEEWAAGLNPAHQREILKQRLKDGFNFAPKHVLQATLLQHFANENGAFEFLDDGNE